MRPRSVAYNCPPRANTGDGTREISCVVDDILDGSVAMTTHAVVIAGGGPDRADAGGRAGAGGDRRRDRRAAREPGARRLALRRSARAHHRGARPARHRRSVPRGGAGDADPGVRPDPAGHQRLPDPPQLRARAVAEPLRAHPGRLGRRAGSADRSRARGDGLRAGRHRRRRRAVRRPVAAGGLPRRVRRRTQRDPQGGRHRVPRVGSDDELADRRGRDGSRSRSSACARAAASARSRTAGAIRRRAAPNSTSSTPTSPPWRISARRSSPPTGRTTACTARPGSPASPT